MFRAICLSSNHGFIEEIESLEDNIYTQISNNIVDYITTEEGGVDCYDSAYIEYHKRLTTALKEKVYPSSNLEISNKDGFKDFFLSTANNECARQNLEYLLDGYIETPNIGQFSFTLIIKKINLLLVDNAVFAPELHWEIKVAYKVDCILSGKIILDSDG